MCSQKDILYLIFYGAAAMLSLAACCYLLYRRANAIAPEVTSPARLRRWTAAFFASMALSHAWYLPAFYLTSAEDVLQSTLVGATLDFMTFVPLGMVVLLSMLQDRRRPLWPVCIAVAPLVVITAVCAATRGITLLPVLYVYYLLLGIGLLLYMVREVRQYSRWLLDNYADLEHKEVWQSLVVLAVILLFFGIYTLDPYYHAIRFIMQLNNMILVCYLLWRVETLSDLSDTFSRKEEGGMRNENSSEGLNQRQDVPPSSESPSPILQQKLQKHCVDTQLYLQHDLTLLQLAKAIGTNRYYLSQYFSRQDTTYNAYINGLRIQHFMNLYRKAVADGQSFTAQQLAMESGFHNYRTFSNAFKNQTGQTVTGWMKWKNLQK
jgi:AraC-like DNA-binding protein